MVRDRDGLLLCSSAGTVKVKSSNIQVGDLILVEKVSWVWKFLRGWAAAGAGVLSGPRRVHEALPRSVGGRTRRISLGC